MEMLKNPGHTVSGVNGDGLMRCLVFHEEVEPEVVQKIADRSYDLGVAVRHSEDGLLFKVPLIMRANELELALESISQAIGEATAI